MRRRRLAGLALTMFIPGMVAHAYTQDIWDAGEVDRVARDVRAGLVGLRGRTSRVPFTVVVGAAPGLGAVAEQRLVSWLPPERAESVEMSAKLLGMLPGDMDLRGVLRDIITNQVGGFYDASSETFYIQSTLTGGFARLVMAHEFTHALDHQYFDLDRGGEDVDTDQGLVQRALLEGSGQALMNQWMLRNIRSLSIKEILHAQADLNTAAFDNAPPFVWVPLLAAVAGGQSFLRRSTAIPITPGAVRMADIERAFNEPPRSSEQILHPVKYWKSSRSDEPREVTCSVELEDGWRIVSEDTLGELYLALCTMPLAERSNLDRQSLRMRQFTNDAARGWGGDRSVLLERDGSYVLEFFSCWDSEADAQEFHDALVAVSADIEAELARYEGADVSKLGFSVRTSGVDRVHATAWLGLDADVAARIARGVTFEEVGE